MANTQIEAMRLALEALEYFSDTSPTMAGKAHAEDAITALRTAIEQMEKQEPVKLRRGDILRCIETDELCTVWATSTTHKTLVKWSGNDFTDYTVEQIGELFWLEPESDDVEIAAEQSDNYAAFHAGVRFARAHPPAAPYRAVKTVHEGKPVYVSEPAAPVQEPVAWREAVLDLIDDCPGLTMEQDHWLTRRVKEIDALSAAQQEHEPENEPHVSLASVREDWGPGPHEVHSLPAQRQWVGLTDVEWMNIVNKNQAWFGMQPDEVAHEVCKLTEAKLREKNGGAA